MITTSEPCPAARTDDRGAAIIIALVATVLLSALGLGLVMLSDTESAIAANYRDGSETLYAADAAVERVVQDILLVPRWNDILSGAATSAFVDSTLTPTTPGGDPLDLVALTAEIQAQSDATAPWAANNPIWRLYAYGPLSDLSGTGSIRSTAYVVVWVADDPAETDDDPSADVNGVLTLFAQAFGRTGSMRSVEVTVAKTDTTEIERGLIAQRGQEELNQRARKAAVELPGKALSVSDMNLAAGGMVQR
ncbi:MAG TPA: pilus assembly PilX N-terminal domain-containing protein [Vicinamibacterales bacterium]|nr:pilus assembly PilX N-terminal domain-containing protein [Vicinamibacterales bacterium]